MLGVSSVSSFFFPSPPTPPILYRTEGSSGPHEGHLYVWEFIPWKLLHYFQIVFPNLKLVESPGTIKEEFTVFLGTHPSIFLLTEAGDTFI